jgi:hypothetical protein
MQLDTVAHVHAKDLFYREQAKTGAVVAAERREAMHAALQIGLMLV